VKAIWKYELEVTDLQRVSMPVGAKPICVQVQGDLLCLWAEVNTEPERPRGGRTFEIIGTGNPIPEAERAYIGTVQMPPFVWHVYERI